MPSKTKSAKSRIYQLKITIKDIRPPVWRRLRVPGNVTFQRLHEIIQDAFGWTDSHLHEFLVGGIRYGDPEGYGEFETESNYRDEAEFVLERIVRAPRKRFVYTYDFGDGWRHEILVEKIEDATPGENKLVCVAGRRHCPPEDCGGPWGYADFLETLRDPNHEEHEAMLEWIGPGFDPEHFDLDDTNQALSVERPMRDHGVNWIQ